MTVVNERRLSSSFCLLYADDFTGILRSLQLLMFCDSNERLHSGHHFVSLDTHSNFMRNSDNDYSSYAIESAHKATQMRPRFF